MQRVSIITVSYNSAKTIRSTIDSVLSQDYPNVEYIIYDGGSTDGTQEIVKSYGSKINKFVSEKDKGLYDAMNKGIHAASGDVIGILNSDDVYAHSHVISTVIDTIGDNTDCVFGDLFFFKGDEQDKVIRHYRGKNFSPAKIRFGILPPHPTLFVRKSVYDRYGKFDLQFKFAADFDFMARIFYVHRVSYKYIPDKMVKMRLGGISTGNFRRIIAINKEDLRSCLKNGIRTNFFLFHLKYFSKVLGVRSFVGLIRH
jgi:glycosyltransferase involved in cell wall biosynthesis